MGKANAWLWAKKSDRVLLTSGSVGVERQFEISGYIPQLRGYPRGDGQMAKPTTIKIRLNSTADTGHFYVAKKNSRTMTEKMVVKKYDPIVRKHVEYKEGKIK